MEKIDLNMEEVDQYYQNQAKRIIDSMFDVKMFNSNITRDDMKGFEDLIAFHFQSFAKSERAMANFSKLIKDKNYE